MILVFIGITLAIALYFNRAGNASLFALVPFGIGAALLIFYFAVDKKKVDALEAIDQAKSADAKRSPTV